MLELDDCFLALASPCLLTLEFLLECGQGCTKLLRVR
jgi:hypothetical protein